MKKEIFKKRKENHHEYYDKLKVRSTNKEAAISCIEWTICCPCLHQQLSIVHEKTIQQSYEKMLHYMCQHVHTFYPNTVKLP